MGIFSRWKPILYNEEEHIYQILKQEQVKQNQNEIISKENIKQKIVELKLKNIEYKNTFDYKSFKNAYIEYKHYLIFARILFVLFFIFMFAMFFYELFKYCRKY